MYPDDWKLALAQHPMYLLIREDTQCAERTPPWGAPEIALYIDRVRQNLAALRRYPRLKLGYEWSALELELLACDAPDVFEEMCSLAREGRIAFYNGTYSQPHLQTLSSEANVRQFEYGMRVYRELCGQRVHVYAHQESSVHDQMPQLLRAFGVEIAVVPGFFSTLAWLEEGELVVHGAWGLRFVHGHEFVAWRGLDGTEIPLYLHQPVPWGTKLKDWLAQEAVVGRLRVPPVIVSIPDMISVDEAWLAEHQDVELVLLDEALEERWQRYPPRARARLFTNWSYIEGIRAEELSRSNWRAETSVLRAEALSALAFTLLRRPASSTDAIWKTILTTQHHDVYCFCAPELREKAIRWLQEAERQATHMADEAAHALIAQIRCEDSSGQPVIIFNPVPHAQKGLVALDVMVDRPTVVDHQGREIPVEALPTEHGLTRVRFLADMPGLGYATYQVHGGGERTTEEELNGSLSFENDFYRATVHPDGTFTSLVVKPSGDELLDARTVRGNQLAAMDSTGLSPKREGPADLAHRQAWEPPQPGPDLLWRPAAPSHVRHSPLGVTLIATGRLSEQVKVDLTVTFYHQLPRIDLTWTFVFDTASIGTFFNDDSKLRVHWPLAFAGDVHHDIPFGVISARDERPFFPASWVDISDGKKGLAYFHQGTPKHWITGRLLVNLFAWGEDTDAIGNRLERTRWPKAFDQRLRGSHTIHCALYPHPGDWRAADMISAARSYNFPPVAYLAEPHEGHLPASLEVLTLTDSGVAATAVKVAGSQVICRVYAATGKAASVEAKLQGLRAVGLRSLGGGQIAHLEPFQIGELILEPVRGT